MNSNKISLEEVGWNLFFKESFAPYKVQGFIPGRITQVQRKNYLALTEIGEIKVKLAGNFRFDAKKEAYPVVGDWVAIKHSNSDIGVIQTVLPRKNKISRKVRGKVIEEQIMLANIDTVWIVSALDKTFDIQQIEKYLILVSESGANPVVILNKSDLCDNIDKKIEDVRKISPTVPIHSLSAELNKGLEKLNQYLVNGQTIAIIGSSGVGKSSIINKLLSVDRQKVGLVRKSDSGGRHTTTYREMIIFPEGGIIIDNPGINKINLWIKSSDLNDVFKDIEDIAKLCKFKNCNHKTEPKCAIKDAIENEELDKRRLEHYLKLRKEDELLAIKQKLLKKR